MKDDLEELYRDLMLATDELADLRRTKGATLADLERLADYIEELNQAIKQRLEHE